MKKTVIFYVLMILTIAFLAGIGDMQFGIFSFIKFSHKLHIIMETVNSLLLVLIFLAGKILYSETKDERFLILSYGFLAGMLFNLVHIFTLGTFPYDNFFFDNIERNPSLIYLQFSNLILPLSIYFSLMYKSSFSDMQDNLAVKKINVTSFVYFFLFLTITPLIFYYFLPQFLNQAYIIMHTMEYINYALYLMTASILINSRISSNQCPLTLFIGGLLILGLGGLFYINPLLLPANGVFAHLSQTLGLFLLLLGLFELPSLSFLLRVKDDFVIYLSLFLISFYIVFVPLMSGLFHIITPQSAGFIFIEFLLFFQLIIYAFSTISWNKIASRYLSAERDRALVRVFESMRRISNPNIIKDTIINEINNSFQPDECFIVIYNQESNSFEFDKYSEFLPSKTLVNFEVIDNEALEFEKFQDTFNNIEISFSNVDEYINRCSLKGTPQEKLLKEYKLKSLFSIPINYNNKLLGYLILQYKNMHKDFTADDFSFLNKMTAQLGIAMSNAN